MSGPIFSFNGLLGAATDFWWLVGRQIATKPPNRQQAKFWKIKNLWNFNLNFFLNNLSLNAVLTKFWKIRYLEKILEFEIFSKKLENLSTPVRPPWSKYQTEKIWLIKNFFDWLILPLKHGFGKILENRLSGQNIGVWNFEKKFEKFLKIFKILFYDFFKFKYF